MPDLSDKVSELRIPEHKIKRLIATLPGPVGLSVVEAISMELVRSCLTELLALRTRPTASTMEGWRTMDSAPKEIGVLELGEDGSVKTTLRPEEFTSAIIAAGTYTIYAAPIPPEVMK